MISIKRGGNVVTRRAGLHGVALVAERFEAQVRFYEKVLGLRLVQQGGGYAELGLGEQRIVFFDRDHDLRSTQRLAPGRHGLSHLELSLSPEHRLEVVDRLHRAGAQAHGENYLDADGQLFHFV